MRSREEIEVDLDQLIGFAAWDGICLVVDGHIYPEKIDDVIAHLQELSLWFYRAEQGKGDLR